MNPQLRWLIDLRESMPDLTEQQSPRPYWSQRKQPPKEPTAPSLDAVVRRVRREIDDLTSQHWFASTLGFDCVDSNGEVETSIEDQLDRRVGKAHLVALDDAEWTEDDLCDFVEVYHDLSARPTRGWYHPYANCGFHPSRFAHSSGMRIYRWRINKLLAASTLGLRLAEEGEDIGRMVRVLSDGLQLLAASKASSASEAEPEIAHAIALLRRHGGSREDRRLAVVGLARVLEVRRVALKEHLLSKDEQALFQIANKFDLRHRKADQMADYGDDYLDWIFHWYLATIDLLDRVLATSQVMREH